MGNQAPWTSEHTRWLFETGEKLKTTDGKSVTVFDFRHENDGAALSAWAKHLRNHYCLDTDIEFLRGEKTRQEYLNELKFPSRTTRLGPSIRAGDFGEILVADYLQWHLDFWVPRLRWSSKVIRDESPKGSDVVGFRFQNEGREISPRDVLAIFEAKTKFSASKKNCLQEAINDSAKDPLRKAESLNFMKQKFFERRDLEQAELIERFQSPVDLPYQEIYGAAALISDEFFDLNSIAAANCSETPQPTKFKNLPNHLERGALSLVVIKGPEMMNLVHELYRRAADEA